MKGVSLLLMSSVLVSVEKPSQPSIFRVKVEAVQVDVFVGRNRRAVLGLEAEDFQLYDNGVLQDVEVVSTDRAPLSIVLVFDTSKSVQGKKLRYLKEAAASLLSELEPGDRIGLLGFDSRLTSTGELTQDAREVRRSLEQIQGAGFTTVHDGLYAGLQMIADEDRALLVLFTDGSDNFSWLTEKEVLDVVRHSNAVVEVVATRLFLEESRASGRAGRQTRFFLEAAALLSGGRFRSAASEKKLKDIFRQIIVEMKTRYVLTYYPLGVDSTGWHELEVKVEGREVAARRGYFSDPPCQ